jgi:hypothetical protein
MKPITTSKGVTHDPSPELVRKLLKSTRKRLELTRHQLRNPWMFEAPAGTVFMFAKYNRFGSLIATVARYNPDHGGWIPML